MIRSVQRDTTDKLIYQTTIRKNATKRDMNEQANYGAAQNIDAARSIVKRRVRKERGVWHSTANKNYLSANPRKDIFDSYIWEETWQPSCRHRTPPTTGPTTEPNTPTHHPNEPTRGAEAREAPTRRGHQNQPDQEPGPNPQHPQPHTSPHPTPPQAPTHTEEPTHRQS